MAIKDFYNVSPDDLKPGDVMVCTLVVHMEHHIPVGEDKPDSGYTGQGSGQSKS